MSVNLLRDVVKPIVSGFGITAKRLKVKKVTVMYPEQRREQYPRTRWRHFLTRYESGLERCIGCSLVIGPGGGVVLQGRYGEGADELLYGEIGSGSASAGGR